MIAPEHLGYESLPTAITVVRGDEIVYANRAACALTGNPDLLGSSVHALIDRAMPDAEGEWAHELNAARVAGRDTPKQFWLSFQRPDGVRVRTQVLRSEGPRANEHTHVFIEVPREDVAVRALTDALSAASWNLDRLADERAVLDTAADSLAAHGFRVVILRAEGDCFMHEVLRQDEATVREVDQRLGGNLWSKPMPRANGGSLAAAFEQRRATFDQDTHLAVDKIWPPEFAALIKATLPRRAATAPISVGGQAWGILSAQKDDLSPAAVGAIELFAHRIGSAMENVGHLRQARQRLEELKALQDKLVTRERLAALGEAAAVLSHEMRNPIGAILNATAMLGRCRPEESKDVLRIIEEESLRLDQLVRDLLHLARPLQPKMTEVDLCALAERAIATVRGRFPEAVPVERIGDGPVRALGDSFLLELAVENLLSNALRVSPAAGKVQVSLSCADRMARIAVDDMGPGIDPELAPRLFQPFFTTHATGTGLGLAVVRKVVEAHGGEVRALKGPLGGARFEIELRAG